MFQSANLSCVWVENVSSNANFNIIMPQLWYKIQSNTWNKDEFNPLNAKIV